MFLRSESLKLKNHVFLYQYNNLKDDYKAKMSQFKDILMAIYISFLNLGLQNLWGV